MLRDVLSQIMLCLIEIDTFLLKIGIWFLSVWVLPSLPLWLDGLPAASIQSVDLSAEVLLGLRVPIVDILLSLLHKKIVVCDVSRIFGSDRFRSLPDITLAPFELGTLR